MDVAQSPAARWISGELSLHSSSSVGVAQSPAARSIRGELSLQFSAVCSLSAPAALLSWLVVGADDGKEAGVFDGGRSVEPHEHEAPGMVRLAAVATEGKEQGDEPADCTSSTHTSTSTLPSYMHMLIPIPYLYAIQVHNFATLQLKLQLCNLQQLRTSTTAAEDAQKGQLRSAIACSRTAAACSRPAAVSYTVVQYDSYALVVVEQYDSYCSSTQ